MFTIEMLPASYGDCLWIEYGEPGAPHRILIDGGKASTYDAIRKHANTVNGVCVFELLVVTHIDADHIEGIVKLLSNLPPNVKFNQVWFNGWDQISNRLGAPAGEYLTHYIRELKIPWNTQFDGRSVVVPDDGSVPRVALGDGMTITVLSPNQKGLDDLVPVWLDECKKAGIVEGSAPQKPGRLSKRRLGDTLDVKALAMRGFDEDTSVPNGSSIALLAEFDGKSCLLAGDAAPGVIVESIQKHMKLNQLKVSAFKIPHHGSKNNTSLELARLVETKKYLISTNGAIYNHPDPEAIARILTAKKTDADLYFNYLNVNRNGVWKDPMLKSKWRYEATFPKSMSGEIKIDL